MKAIFYNALFTFLLITVYSTLSFAYEQENPLTPAGPHLSAKSETINQSPEDIRTVQDRSSRPIRCYQSQAAGYFHKVDCTNHQEVLDAMQTVYYQVNTSTNPVVRAYADACRDAINTVSNFPLHLKGNPGVYPGQLMACNAALNENNK